MKCSLKDGLISILLIILIAPSKGIEFPLLLQTNSVLDKPMNFQQFKAAINRLQDLDSFPDVDNSEGKLHKIVKKQMAVSDSNELRKTKGSTLSVFNWPTNCNRAARNGDEIIRKEGKKKKYGAKNFDRFYGGSQHQDSKITDEILATLKDIIKDKQYFFVNRMEKKILLQKMEEKKAKAKNHIHSSHMNSGLKEYTAGVRPKSALKEKLKLANPVVKPRMKEKQNIAKTAAKVKQHSAYTSVKEKPSLTKTSIKEPPNTQNTPVKEAKIAPNTAIKEIPNIPNIAIKEIQNTPNSVIKEAQNNLNIEIKEAQNVPNTEIKETKNIPNIAIKDIQNILSTEIKEAQNVPNTAIKDVQNFLSTEIKEAQNVPNTAIKEVQNILSTEIKEAQNVPNTAIKEAQNVRNIEITETQNTVNTAGEQRQSSPNNPISEKQYSVSAEAKEIADAAKTAEIQISQMNSFLRKKFTRIPDERDYRYYYECEEKPFGCMKLRHKRCPEGQFFSYKYLKCLKAPSSRCTTATTLTNWQAPALQVLKEPALKVLKESTLRCLKAPALKKLGKAKRTSNNPYPKKIDIFDNSEDPEPANEWMDANQGSIQKIPPEFKPKKTPGLKIYHLCSKRRMKALLQKTKKRHILENSFSKRKENKRNMADVIKRAVKRHSPSQHHPRSFVIHIKKKEGKENHDQGITESDESEEDEENDEDDDDEDSEDEDDEAEDEVQENTEEKSSRKDTLKEFFKSAKAAVTNRARFNDPSLTEPEATQKGSNLKTKNSAENSNLKEKNKKVLLDANIKVDSTIGSALKYILKSKTKDKESHGSLADNERLISDRGSQDQLDPELIRMYEHLIRNNSRGKRHFLANCSKKGN